MMNLKILQEKSHPRNLLKNLPFPWLRHRPTKYPHLGSKTPMAYGSTVFPGLPPSNGVFHTHFQRLKISQTPAFQVLPA